MNEPSFRFKQIVHWLYKKRVQSFDEMRNISKSLQQSLENLFSISKLPISFLLESQNHDAVKFGFTIDDDFVVESVLLFDGKRRTLCMSSQLGCALGCTFCATGKIGLIRNLRQSEIIGQLIAANDYLHSKDDRNVTNIVFMGMGEALLNFDTLLSVLEIIMDERCFSIGGRKVTVSTAGVVPAVKKFLAQNLNIGLAISLNSYNNEKRNVLMPINKTYPLESLVETAYAFYRQYGQPLTFEYICIDGENDTDEAVEQLTALLAHVPCKINLIPYNSYKNGCFTAPSEEKIHLFSQKLFNNGLTVTVRKSKGRDICGACGQLAGDVTCEP